MVYENSLEHYESFDCGIELKDSSV